MKKIFANYLEHLKRTMEDRAQQGKQATLDEILADYAERAGLNKLQKRALRRQHFVKIAVDFTQMDAKKDRELVDKGLAPPSVLPGVQPGSKKEKKLRRRKHPDTAWEDPESAHQDKASFDGTDNDSASNLMTGESENRAVFGLASVKDLRKKVRTLQKRLLDEFMLPNGTLNQPKWDPTKDWQDRLDLESKINQTLVDLDEAQVIEVGKKQDATPTGKAEQNNVEFLREFDRAIKAKGREERGDVVRRLSPEGIQHAYDTALERFRKSIYYKDTQSYDQQQGDYVRCAICNWVNPTNPSLLPASHLTEHKEELEATNRGMLINEYLKQYPESAMQSREQELAAFIEGAVGSVLNKRLTEISNVATEREKGLYYSDGALFDLVLHNLRRLKINPADIDHQQLATQVVDDIKQDLAEEYADRYDANSEIGNLEDRNIPWHDFHQIVSATINNAAREYDGLIVRRRALREEPTRPPEKEISKTQFNEPTKEEIQEKGLIPVKLSTNDTNCWNCGQNYTIFVKSDLKSVNSVVCPSCGVYREIPINWECPDCKEQKQLVIRDPNEKPEASKLYTVYCDDNRLGNGEQAIGNSKYVLTMGSSQRQYQTTRDDKPTSSETFESPITTSDSVSSDQYGIGKVVYIGSGNQLFVDFPENPRTVKLDRSEGEVIYLQTSRPGYTGYYMVEEVHSEPTTTKLTVKLRGEAGQVFTREFSSGDADMDIPVATEISQKHVTKADLTSDRMRRIALTRKFSNEFCTGQEVIEIKRHNKPAPTRADLLKNRVRRARVIDRVRRS